MSHVPTDRDERPDPDRLLRVVREEEEKGRRGRLKVYLGMSAGVGKTYAMLRAAHGLREEGVDVVVAVVETHGRPETAALLEGLEICPRARLSHRGCELEDMDLDGILARRPQVALVDELAHSNAPGSRNGKRWQDVEEILRQGIDVQTTVNIQHVESRKSIVEDFAGVKVQETVPDVFFDRADELVVIDLDPDELLERLSEGNVYQGEKKEFARANFFTPVNLTALRELALRFTAGRVERDLHDERHLSGDQTGNARFATNTLLVAVFASPYSEALLRHTKRLAESLHARWVAAYVEGARVLSADEKDILARNFALVSSMGGELVTTSDTDPVRGILRIARQNGVTQIVVGKSNRGILARLLQGGSVTERLLKESGEIDVHVVSGRRRLGGERAVAKPTLEEAFLDVVPFRHLGVVAGTMFATWGLGAFLTPFIGYQAVGFLFLFAVFLSAFYLRRMAVYAFAALAGLVWNLFFIPPLYTFSISQPEDWALFAMFFVVALLVAGRTHRLRSQEARGREREKEARTLYRVARRFAEARTREEVTEAIPAAFVDACGVPAALVMPGLQGRPRREQTHGTFALGEKELSVAAWVFENARAAGRGTDTLADAEGYFFPLASGGVVLAVGVLGVPPSLRVPRELLATAETIGHQAAVALERESFRESTLQIALLEKTRKLYDALFDSVSHELRIPLAGIEGGASAILDAAARADASALSELASIMNESAQRLRNTIENILDMTRLESGHLSPKTEAWEPGEIVQSTLRGLARELEGRKIKVELPPDNAHVSCDIGLTVVALRNIVLNAARHTPQGSVIEIGSCVQEDSVILRVRDYGPGLPPDAPRRVFKKFYRGEPSKTGGLGLGLSIAAGFLEAQGGTLSARNSDDGESGAIFELRLPRAREEDSP